jgi:hypothetical protein
VFVTCVYGDSAKSVCSLLTFTFTEQQILLFLDAGTFAFESSRLTAPRENLSEGPTTACPLVLVSCQLPDIDGFFDGPLNNK